jgi:hypothetical protein
MKLDAELDLWREQWQSSPAAPLLPDLRKRVARQSLCMRIMLAADILVTLVIGGGAIVFAIQDPRPATALLAAATWLFIAAAWIFGLSNRKNAWSPSASTTSAFLDLSIRRTRANLRAVTFGAILYVVEMAFSLSWVYRESGRWSTTLTTAITLITLMLAALMIVYRKKKRADLTYLLQLQRDQTTAE